MGSKVKILNYTAQEINTILQQVEHIDSSLSEESENPMENEAIFKQYMDQRDTNDLLINLVPESQKRALYKNQYLTFDILTDGQLKWGVYTDSDTPSEQIESDRRTIKYSLNGGEWTEITSKLYNEEQTFISVQAGDKIRFKGTNSGYGRQGRYEECCSSFNGSTCEFNVSGNIMSLIDEDNFEDLNTFTTTETFYYLFCGCLVISAKYLILPSGTTKRCYANMFSCRHWSAFGSYVSKLKEAPELPALTLAEGCYVGMFWYCTELEVAPDLPATTLVTSCYGDMFAECYSLIKAPELLATTLETYVYSEMFYNCTSLVKAPIIPATIVKQGSCMRMFSGCSSLADIQEELPAMTLAKYCYNGMFAGTNISRAPRLPATILFDSCYTSMFANCKSLVNVPAELPALTVVSSAYQNMFSRCTSLVESPDIKATKIEQSGAAYMFDACSSLNKITCRATQIGNYGTSNWVRGVAASGDFYLATYTVWNSGVNGYPSGWTTHRL